MSRLVSFRLLKSVFKIKYEYVFCHKIKVIKCSVAATWSLCGKAYVFHTYLAKNSDWLIRKTACVGNLRKVLAFFMAVFGSSEDCPVDQDGKEAVPSRAEPKRKSTVKASSKLRKCWSGTWLRNNSQPQPGTKIQALRSLELCKFTSGSNQTAQAHFQAEANWKACGMLGRQTADVYCALAPLAIVLMGWSSWETIWLLLMSILFSYNADCAEARSCQQSASSVISREEKWSDIWSVERGAVGGGYFYNIKQQQKSVWNRYYNQ